MALFRTENEDKLQNYGKYREDHVVIANEWDENSGLARYLDPVWEKRYRDEARLIADICEAKGYRKILELGSGPGQLGQFVLELNPKFSYSYIDKPAAEIEFKRRNFKGEFFVKDLLNSFDTSGLDSDYDLIVANDFLEHISNPSDVMHKSRKITKNNSGFFISVPNWRMGHTFIYRGLFDFDNWVYFCKIHGWDVESVDGSNLKCKMSPKLSSEEMLPDDLINSWNWYFNCSKKQE
jgi:SAM-dependent methyltransferase